MTGASAGPYTREEVKVVSDLYRYDVETDKGGFLGDLAVEV
jgi:hypothetical protein